MRTNLVFITVGSSFLYGTYYWYWRFSIRLLNSIPYWFLHMYLGIEYHTNITYYQVFLARK